MQKGWFKLRDLSFPTVPQEAEAQLQSPRSGGQAPPTSLTLLQICLLPDPRTQVDGQISTLELPETQSPVKSTCQSIHMPSTFTCPPSHLKSALSFHQARQMSPHNRLDTLVLDMVAGLLPLPTAHPWVSAPHLPPWSCSPSVLERFQLRKSHCISEFK